MSIDSPLLIHCIYRPRKYRDMTIYPIACPSLKALANYGIATSENPDNILSSGLNGEVYSTDLSQPQVVKKLFTAGQANNYQPSRERKALVALEANGITSRNIQCGLLAIKNKDGDTFIISTEIRGKKPNPATNKFSAANMAEMIDTIAYLDTPGRYWNHKKPFRNPADSLLMHYDLKPGNILIDGKNFGIIDFEYLDFIRLFSGIKKGKEHLGVLCNYSDNAEVPSNLRNMEYRTLLPYLEKLNKEEAKDLFTKYLQLKSVYHGKMVKAYSHFMNTLPPFSILSVISPKHSSKKITQRIIDSELAHMFVLKNPNENTIKSEAIKIQIARYLYLLSTHSHGEKTEINLEQVKKYILDAEKFFDEKENLTKGHEKTYYSDNKKLIKLWKRIIPIISNDEAKSKLDYYKDISGISNDSGAEENLNKTIYTKIKQTTLDERVI